MDKYIIGADSPYAVGAKFFMKLDLAQDTDRAWTMSNSKEATRLAGIEAWIVTEMLLNMRRFQGYRFHIVKDEANG
jgi:hypothetical protein